MSDQPSFAIDPDERFRAILLALLEAYEQADNHGLSWSVLSARGATTVDVRKLVDLELVLVRVPEICEDPLFSRLLMPRDVPSKLIRSKPRLCLRWSSWESWQLDEFDAAAEARPSLIGQRARFDGPCCTEPSGVDQWVELQLSPAGLQRAMEVRSDVSVVPVGPPDSGSGSGKTSVASGSGSVNASPAKDEIKLKRCERLACESYEHAVKEMPDPGTDSDVYEWLAKHGTHDADYKLPAFDTWARYVRAGRKAHAERQKEPRAGPTARSIHHASEIDSPRRKE